MNAESAINAKVGTANRHGRIGANLISDPQTYQVNDSGLEADLWSATIDANALKDYGDSIRVRADGAVGSVANTRTIRLKFGSITLAAIITVNANESWWFDVTIYKDAGNGGNSIRCFGMMWNTSTGLQHVTVNSTNITLSSSQTLKITAHGTTGAGTSWTQEYAHYCDYIARGDLTP